MVQTTIQGKQVNFAFLHRKSLAKSISPDAAAKWIFCTGPDAERFHILLRPDPSDGALDGQWWKEKCVRQHWLCLAE